jgi:endonuclease YncB( thermonuclease family)
MAIELPDRLSTDPASPHYNEDVLARDVGIRFNGTDKTNVEEYCVSEGWIRVAAGKTRDRKGNPLTIKLKGTVEPYFRDAKQDE